MEIQKAGHIMTIGMKKSDLLPEEGGRLAHLNTHKELEEKNDGNYRKIGKSFQE